MKELASLYSSKSQYGRAYELIDEFRAKLSPDASSERLSQLEDLHIELVVPTYNKHT